MANLPTSAAFDTSEAGRRLLEIIDGMVRELHPGRREHHRLAGDSRLGRDLGLDSLARSELLLRVEREFDVTLPEHAVEAETPDALLHALLAAHGRAGAGLQLEPFPEPGSVAGAPQRAATLTEALDWHLQQHAGRVHIHLYGDEDEPQPLTYRDLDQGARSVAAGLVARGVQPGDTVALMLPTSRDYFFAFCGILYAGAVPVPIYPPLRASQLEEHLRRHGRILTNADTAMLVTVPEARALARLMRAEAPKLHHIETVATLSASESLGKPRERCADDLTLLQYTSGSTGDPKGVMLSHRNLLANIRAMGQRLDVSSRDGFVSWLPLYHDMGLIGAWLSSLYYAMPLAVMSPLAFLTRPVRWLRAIHRHRATISGGPNFGYELCLRAVDPEALEGLDLSSWRMAFNGAEQVSPVTLERFWQRMAPSGLRREALMPVYGLAEAALGLTFPHPGTEPRVERVDRALLTHSARAEPSQDESALSLVGCGVALPGYDLRIVDDAGRELAERREGNLQFRGPSATAGYFRNPEATRELFDGDWLRTGDRGYLADGELFVTGRTKDVIVRGGRNIYPYELEEAIGAVPGVRKGCVAVFGSPDPVSGTERLVVVAETREETLDARERIETAIRQGTLDIVNIPADDIRLVPPHGVLKTSSGKIRRAATAQLYRTGRLGARPVAVWRQVVRLTLATAATRLRRRGRLLGEQVYAGYAWSVFGLIAAPLWLLAVVLRRRHWCWVAMRRGIRLGMRLSGVAIERRGLEHLPANRRYLLAVNHASYLDALVLTAALPHDYRYLAKRELGQRFFARVLLRRLGTLFVERFELRQTTADAQQVFAAVAAGDPLVFFAEGTFDAHPGLRPFHMGAFVAAARDGLPVVPVALRGTRALLRGDEWFPRPGRAQVIVGPPVAPTGTDWEAALALRDRVREFILAQCGERDLAQDTNQKDHGA